MKKHLSGCSYNHNNPSINWSLIIQLYYIKFPGTFMHTYKYRLRSISRLIIYPNRTSILNSETTLVITPSKYSNLGRFLMLLQFRGAKLIESKVKCAHNLLHLRNWVRFFSYLLSFCYVNLLFPYMDWINLQHNPVIPICATYCYYIYISWPAAPHFWKVHLGQN